MSHSLFQSMQKVLENGRAYRACVDTHIISISSELFMDTYIIIPCLDEESNLAKTCASLGFPHGSDPSCRLVLVDNGSKDNSLRVMSEICNASPSGNVHVVGEPKKGVVHARARGAEVVLNDVQVRFRNPQNVLVLQADADTIYLPSYVEQLMLNARTAPLGTLLEGYAVTSEEFSHDFPKFDSLGIMIDYSMEQISVNETDDVVVDDKICAYRLSDYLRWGGINLKLIVLEMSYLLRRLAFI